MRAKSLQWCLTLCDPRYCSPPGSSVHGDSPGKNTGVSCRALLQGVFPNQGWNLCLLWGNLIQICVQSDIVLGAEFKPFDSISELPLSKGILW